MVIRVNGRKGRKGFEQPMSQNILNDLMNSDFYHLLDQKCLPRGEKKGMSREFKDIARPAEAYLLRALFEFQLNLKLFHFQTQYYGAHKAADWLGKQFANRMDELMEVIQGKYGRVPAMRTSIDIETIPDSKMPAYARHFIRYLSDIETQLDDNSYTNSDLITVIDQIKDDVNKFIYLLSFR